MMTLLNSQSSAIDKLSPLKVGALFKRPGTGKSRTAIELIRSTPNIDYILWLAPFSSVHPKVEGSGIRSEVDRWGGFDCEVDFIGIETMSCSDRTYLRLREKLSSRNSFIVCDESLKIKNETANRTKRIIDLGSLASFKLILNGTPISRNLLDIWSQMQFLSPLILNMSHREFYNTFCCYTTIKKRIGRTKWISREFITGYENIDYLYSLIRPYVYEADLQLTVSQQHISIPYKIDECMKGEYERLKSKYLNDEAIWLNHNIFLEMTMKMQHGYCCASDKIDICRSIIRKHGPENVIIYTKFISSNDLCKKAFPGVTVLSIQSDSMSLNLQSKHVTIEFDKTWDYAIVDQYHFRTYRTGQSKDCYYYYLDGDTKLDKLIVANNEKKIKQLEYFKGITKAELKEVL